MIDQIFVSIGGGLIAAVLIIEIFKACRRTRITNLSCCCGLFTIQRDPLQGTEITEDAKAETLYPEVLDEIKCKLTGTMTLSTSNVSEPTTTVENMENECNECNEFNGREHGIHANEIYLANATETKVVNENSCEPQRCLLRTEAHVCL